MVWPIIGAFSRAPSGLDQCAETAGRRAERAELVNGGPHRREGERGKRFGEHGVVHGSGSHAGGDMGAEALARVLRQKAGHVVDQGLVEGGVAMVGSERLDRAGGQGGRDEGIHDGLLQLEQCGRGAGR